MSSFSLPLVKVKVLRAQLNIIRQKNAKDYSKPNTSHFVVVDLDRPFAYPRNFVCLLPLSPGKFGVSPNSFTRVFGVESLETARRMLTNALKSEADEGVRGEIERRIKLLVPSNGREKRCGSCGKLFTTKPAKMFRQRFCEDCVKKKFGCRTL